MGNELQATAATARDLVADFYLEAARLLNDPLQDVPDAAAEAAFELSYACAITSESALVLLAQQHVWDADILARSVVEGTLKLLYLLFGSSEDMQLRSTEFFETVPDCQALARLTRAQQLLDIVEDRNAPEWAAIHEVVEIDVPVAERLRGTNGASRHEVQRRWSFTGLVEAIAQLPGLESTAVLGYTYGMQSHLVHKDSNGTGMMYEREDRASSRREAAMLAHGARIVADIAGMASVRATAASRVSSGGSSSLNQLTARLEKLEQSTKALELLWREVEYPNVDRT